MTMSRLVRTALAAAVFLGTTPLASAYDLLLVPANFHPKPGTSLDIKLSHGTLREGQNPVLRSRMQDVTILVDGKTTRPGDDQWTDVDDGSILKLAVRDPGTYAVGVSLKPKIEEWSVEGFAGFLKYNGIEDLPVDQRPTLPAGQKLRLRYTKHARTFLQVGTRHTRDFAHVLGYPAEIIPNDDPSGLKIGDTLSFTVLNAGKPAANTVVYATYKNYHEHDVAEEDEHMEYWTTLHTDSAGVAKVHLSHAGPWALSANFLSKPTDGGAEYDHCQTSFIFFIP